MRMVKPGPFFQMVFGFSESTCWLIACAVGYGRADAIIVCIFCKGFIQKCLHDIHVGTKIDSDTAIVFFRNVVLDPVYLDMVLYLLSSAQYNSISYKLESFLWMKQPVATAFVGSRAPEATIVYLVPNDERVTRVMQSSYQCALVLQSELSADSQHLGHKTDLYNITKLRSFIYTSLNVFSIDNIDIIARARWFTLLVHDSPFNDMEIAVRADQALAACFPETASDASASDPPLRASDNADTLCVIHSYIQHGRQGRPSVTVTEIRVKSRFNTHTVFPVSAKGGSLQLSSALFATLADATSAVLCPSAPGCRAPRNGSSVIDPLCLTYLHAKLSCAPSTSDIQASPLKPSGHTPRISVSLLSLSLSDKSSSLSCGPTSRGGKPYHHAISSPS